MYLCGTHSSWLRVGASHATLECGQLELRLTTREHLLLLLVLHIFEIQLKPIF